MNIKFTVTAALMATALVACGGNSSKKDNDGGSTATTDPNPIVSGKFKTEASQVINITPKGSVVVIAFDPAAKTYTTTITATDGAVTTLTGAFDAATNTLGEATCTGACNGVSTAGAVLDTSKWVGDGAVILSTENGTFFGSTPSTAANLPGGKVTYTGEAYVKYSKNGVVSSGMGDSTTTVNFGAGKLSTKFDGFSGDLAGFEGKVRDAKISGPAFSGGVVWVKDKDGVLTSFEDTADVGGHFFGLNGEEVAGSASGKVDNPKKQVTFDAGWYGAQ